MGKALIKLLSQGADPSPLPLHAGTAGKSHLNEEITPPPPHWDRRETLPKHIKFRTCDALAPMLPPPINESAELTQGALQLIHYSEAAIHPLFNR